jgi:hypothetical protein
MIRALLAGQKTQTRRVVNPLCRDLPIVSFERWGIEYPKLKLTDWQYERGNPLWISTETDGTTRQWHCPYGEPGGRLWVRESMRTDSDGTWLYSADNEPVGCDMEDDYLMIAWVMGKQTEHCPSIHMPRWASRITLDVIGVHVQRLQNISEADAIAEGIDWAACGHAYASTIGAFADLWDGINAKRGYSFESDPWVWRVEFRKVDQ